MNTLSRTITGGFMIALGLVLIGLALFIKEAFLIPLIYGVPLLVIGFVILFNTKEDKIEEIKSGGKK